MLLSVVWSPEAVEEVTHEVSRYAERATPVTGTFLWGVAIMAIVIFVGAMLSSMRATSDPPK
jgi:hypothetical protein